METPPRTWRRLGSFKSESGKLRNTSTDVEKTNIKEVIPDHFQKHLHGRGEDQTALPAQVSRTETPPRTWRRLPSIFMRAKLGGNTSTDVEKT